MDQDRLKEFQFRMFTDTASALAGILMHVGDRTGLFKAMAGQSAVTADELAAATKLQPRYVLEWLSAMAARKVIDYDNRTGRFSLPEEHALVLADEDSAVFTGGWFQTLPDFYAQTTDLLHAFREGGGVSSEMSADLLEGFSRAASGAVDAVMPSNTTDGSFPAPKTSLASRISMPTSFSPLPILRTISSFNRTVRHSCLPSIRRM